MDAYNETVSEQVTQGRSNAGDDDLLLEQDQRITLRGSIQLDNEGLKYSVSGTNIQSPPARPQPHF